MKYLLLLSLPDMLIIVCDLIPGLFLFGVVGGQGLVEDLVVDLFQIIVAVGHILLRPAPVYIRRKKLPVIMLILPGPIMPDMVVPIKSPFFLSS